MKTKGLALVLTLTTFFLGARLLRSQQFPQLPDTPAAHQFSAWLNVFNGGEVEAMARFLEQSYPTHRSSAEDLVRFRKQTGGFVFVKVEESTATQFNGIVKERDSDQYARVEMEVDAAEPHAITKLGIRAVPRPAEIPMPRMSQEEAIAALRGELEKSAAADEFSGAALVAKNGDAIFQQAYGLADRSKKIPNQIDTRFRIGSMNKMFTAVCVLQLAQAGKINLGDSLGKYLPDYPNKDVASKVTVHELLTHTGGTGDIFGPEYQQHRLELRSLQDYVNLYGKRGFAFEPGSRWEYSNYGFLLLGVMVEKVSGQSYYDCVREHVYKPAGMNSTGSEPESENIAMRSVGYMKPDDGAWQPNTDTLPFRGTSAGGGYSTVGDLLRFANALLHHTLLDAKYTELLTTGKVDTPRGDKYAYGFEDQMRGSVRCYGHGGGAPGMNGDLVICPQSGYTIVVLANMDPPAAQKISRFIADRLPER
ncbi:MAG: serine hydrolase domain-containing protein [Candidatus Acidiferrales bacterium]